ncbi:MAG: hypothetical protein ACI8U4_000746 [Natronomonas sp.]
MRPLRSGAVQFGVLAALVIGIIALPLLFIRLLPIVGGLLPSWFVSWVCAGFLCIVTLLLLGFLLIVPVLWVTAALYDRGYLPEGW